MVHNTVMVLHYIYWKNIYVTTLFMAVHRTLVYHNFEPYKLVFSIADRFKFELCRIMLPVIWIVTFAVLLLIVLKLVGMLFRIVFHCNKSYMSITFNLHDFTSFFGCYANKYIRCTMYTVHCTPYTVHRTLYTVHCTPYTVHCKLYTVQCTVY